MDAIAADPMRFASPLGPAMKRLREKRDLSQEDVARLAAPMGVKSRMTVFRVEKGEETSTTTIDILLRAMGYTARDLYRELGATRVKRQGQRQIPIQAPLVKVS